MDILNQYSNSLEPNQKNYLLDVQGYIESQDEDENEKFQPDESDDVMIRTYLLDCILQGADETEVVRIVKSLQHFYGWLLLQNLINEDPFTKFNFKRSLPDRDQLQHSHDVFLGSLKEREIARLQALNRIGELTNRIASVQSLLDAVLETILDVMEVDTAWVSLRTDSGVFEQEQLPKSEHGFILASALNLPPGLEMSDRHFLIRPPACHCQRLINSGRLKHAVNMVECTRLQDAARSGAHNNGLAYHASVPIVINGRAVGVMNFATRDWQLFSASDLQFLTASARIISSALERAHLYDQNALQRSRMENELRMAQRVQANLLPEEMPHIPRMELAAYWKPSLEMAGDYYNVFKLPNRKWGIVVADVCDKGAPAALYMAITHSLIRERVEETIYPSDLLAHVNAMLCQQNASWMFVTAVYAILDPVNFQLTYATAGHPKPILRRGTGQVEELPAAKSMALGVDPDAVYVDQKIDLGFDDCILFYTDGITEVPDPQGEIYGTSRLSSAIAMGFASAKGMINYLTKDLSAWSGLDHLADDVTLVALRRSKP